MNINDWNTKVLKKQGIQHKGTAPKISRNVGDLQQAALPDGTVVRRQEYLFIDGYGLVAVAPYELHFIYEAPKTQKGWGLFCTCGSIAGVVGWRDYTRVASVSSTGYMVVCIRHNTLKINDGIGMHADGSHE